MTPPWIILLMKSAHRHQIPIVVRAPTAAKPYVMTVKLGASVATGIPANPTVTFEDSRGLFVVDTFTGLGARLPLQGNGSSRSRRSLARTALPSDESETSPAASSPSSLQQVRVRGDELAGDQLERFAGRDLSARDAAADLESVLPRHPLRFLHPEMNR